MGTGGSAPAHSTTYFETSCDIEDPRVIHPFAFRTHTHSLGKVVSGWKVDRSDTWTLIGKRDPQKPQMFYPITDSGLTLTQGDRVAARCTMVNHRDRIAPTAVILSLWQPGALWSTTGTGSPQWGRPTRMRCVTSTSCTGWTARSPWTRARASLRARLYGPGAALC